MYLFRAAPRQMGPARQCLRKHNGAPLPPWGLRATCIWLPTGDSSSVILAPEFSRNLLQTLAWEVSWLFLPWHLFAPPQPGPAAGATQLRRHHSFPRVPPKQPCWAARGLAPVCATRMWTRAVWGMRSDAAGRICDPSNCPVGFFCLSSPRTGPVAVSPHTQDCCS